MESILRELRKLAQDRHSLNQTVLGRFLQCQKLQVCSALLGKAIEQCSRWHRGRALLPLPQDPYRPPIDGARVRSCITTTRRDPP